MAIFRIAQISDLHFGHTPDHLNPIEVAVEGQDRLGRAAAGFGAFARAGMQKRLRLSLYPSTFSPDVAQALLHDLHARFPDLDAVVVTGDIATTGDENDLRLAHDFFAGAIPPEWNPLGSLPSLVGDPSNVLVCLPGNHDRYKGRFLIPGSTNFERRFGELWDFGRDTAYTVDLDCPRVRVCALQQGDAVLFICMADFSLFDKAESVGFGGWIGQGRVAQKTLDDLVQTTKIVTRHAKAAQRTTAVLWAIHFPPEYPELQQGLELIDSGLLIQGARSCDVSAILAGHTHEALQYDIAVQDGPQLRVVCCGSSAGTGDENAFVVLEIEVNENAPNIIATNFVWDKAVRKFQPAASFPKG